MRCWRSWWPGQRRRVAHRRTGSVCLLFKHPALAGETELKKREKERERERERWWMRVLKPYLIHHSWWNISRGARKVVACEPSSSSNNSWDGLERWQNSSFTCISKYSHFLGWFRLRFIESNSKKSRACFIISFLFFKPSGCPLLRVWTVGVITFG
jgi:hypothetical protein